MKTDPTLSDFLEKLGKTPEEIASRLPKGKRGSCFECPVARELKAKFPGYSPAVHATYTEMWVPGDEDSVLQATHPRPLIQFLQHFDWGEAFQDLVEEG